MHLGIFIPALEGGGERVMLDIAEGFFRRGARVDIVLAKCQPDGPYMDQIRPNMRVFDLKATSTLSRLRGLMRYLSTERPGGLITFYDFLNLAAVAKRLVREDTVVVAGVHNTVSELFRTGGLKGHIKLFLFPYLLRMADDVVAVSKGVANDLERRSRRSGPVRVIYNPILVPEMRAQSREAVDHPFFEEGRPPVIIGIGQLAPRKGFDTLIQAFSRVVEKRHARLLILGEGPQRSELEQHVKRLCLSGLVSLPGLVKNPYAFLSKSAVFALSSRFEGLGMVLIEALVLGIPCVATQCPSGPAEILEGGRYGRLVPVDDAGALAEAILHALESPREPRIAACVAERFSLDQAVDAYSNLLTAVWPAHSTLQTTISVRERVDGIFR